MFEHVGKFKVELDRVKHRLVPQVGNFTFYVNVSCLHKVMSVLTVALNYRIETFL